MKHGVCLGTANKTRRSTAAVFITLVVAAVAGSMCLLAPVPGRGGGGAAMASEPGSLLRYAPASSLVLGVDVDRVKDAAVYDMIVDLLIGSEKGKSGKTAGVATGTRSRHRIFSLMGFDPEKDMDSLILSVRRGAGKEVDHVTGQTIFTEQDVLILIKGRFDSAKVADALQKESNGKAKSEEHSGVVVHLMKGARAPGKQVGLAISGGYLMMGGKDLVLDSIGLLTGGAAQSGSASAQSGLAAMIAKVSQEPAWFVVGKDALVLLESGRSTVRNPLAAANEIYGTIGASDAIDIQMTIACENPQFAQGMEQAVAVLLRSLATSPQSAKMGLNELLSGVSLAVVESSVKVGAKIDAAQIGAIGAKLQPAKGAGTGTGTGKAGSKAKVNAKSQSDAKGKKGAVSASAGDDGAGKGAVKAKADSKANSKKKSPFRAFKKDQTTNKADASQAQAQGKTETKAGNGATAQ